MKTVENIFNGRLGCRNPNCAAAFSQRLFELRSPILPGKFPVKERERTASALENLLERSSIRQEIARFNITKTINK